MKLPVTSKEGGNRFVARLRVIFRRSTKRYRAFRRRHYPDSSWARAGRKCLVSVSKLLESTESFGIRRRWYDSPRSPGAADVDD